MGNNSSNTAARRRQNSRRTQPPQQPLQPEITPNRYVVPAPYPSPGYYQYHPPAPGYYPPPPPHQTPVMPMLPAPYDHHHQGHQHHHHPRHPNWPVPGHNYGQMICGPPPLLAATPYVEHQKAVTIRNGVNLKKGSLRIEADDENPGMFLVAFTFDATAPGSITIIFFAKEGEDCILTPTKENILPPVMVFFEQGLGQKFRQPPATGIKLPMFEEAELLGEGNNDVYPLAIRADAYPINGAGTEGEATPGTSNSQITQVVFDEDKGEYKLKVIKQILWVNSMRYELQEIYGIGNSVESDFDGDDPGKECVICLSEPRDTTVLPCRHMCMCRGCAEVLRFQTNRCPICRQPVDRLLEIKVSNGNEEEKPNQV